MKKYLNGFYILLLLVLLSACGDEGDTEGLKQQILLGQLGLTSIEISPRDTITVDSTTLEPINSIYFSINDTEQLSATGYNATNEPFDITSQVSWSVSDTVIASINAAGVLTTMGTAGTVDVTATLSSLSKTQAVTVSGQTPTALELKVRNQTAGSVKTIDVCKDEQLDAIADYTDSKRRITHKSAWSITAGTATQVRVSDAVGSKGLLGTSIATAALTPSDPYTVRASFAGSAGTMDVTANATLISISLTPVGITLAADETQQYIATGDYGTEMADISRNAYNWTSSDLTVATFDTNGLLTGASTGTSDLTASCAAISSAPVLVTVEGVSTLQYIKIDQVFPNGYLSLNLTDKTTSDLTATAYYTNGSSTDVTIDANTNWDIRTLNQVAPVTVNNVDNKGRVATSNITGLAEVFVTYAGKSDDVVVVVQ